MGKASLPKTSINDTLDTNRERKKIFGKNRNARMGVTNISTSMGNGSNAAVGNTQVSTSGLPTTGGTMTGPLALHVKFATVADGVLNVSQGNAYSSRVVLTGQGGVADDLEVITGASHAGQILFLQPIQSTPITLIDAFKSATAWASGQSYSVGDVRLSNTRRYTCSVAHTSASATQPGVGADWETVWYRDNINIVGADDRVVAGNEIVILQWDAVNYYWTLVSGGSVSTGAGLADANVWTNVNTFQSTVNMYGTVNLGDSTADRVNFIAQVGTDINMSTYDVINLDRLKFATTQGAGTALGTSDTGIEAQYSGGSSAGIKFQVPTNNIYQFFSGSSEKINIGSSAITLLDDVIAATTFTVNGETTLGNSSSDDINIVGNIDTDISIAASKKIRAYTSTEIGYYVKNATSAVGSEGTVQIPTKNTGVGNAATANSDFGSEIGCIGLYTLGNPTLVIKYSSTAWQGVIFGSSGNPTVFQF